MLPPCGSIWTIMLHNSGIIDLIAVSGSANIHVQAILDTRGANSQRVHHRRGSVPQSDAYLANLPNSSWKSQHEREQASRELIKIKSKCSPLKLKLTWRHNAQCSVFRWRPLSRQLDTLHPATARGRLQSGYSNCPKCDCVAVSRVTCHVSRGPVLHNCSRM